MPAGQPIGGELRRDAAEAVSEPSAKDRRRRLRTPKRPQQVWRKACKPKRGEDERERDPACMLGVPGGRGDRGACDAEHDREDRNVLTPAAVLSEHAPAGEHEDEQPSRERRLHDDERGEQQRNHLQWPAEQR